MEMTYKGQAIPKERSWKSLQALAAFILLMFFMIRPVHYYLWENLRATFYVSLVPVLLAFYFYQLRFRGTVEIKLIIFYWLWYTATRFLNGGECVVNDFITIINFSLYVIFTSVCMIQGAEDRKRLLVICFVPIALYYTALAAISVIGGIYRLTLYNPITGGWLVKYSATGFVRLELLDQNPNTTGSWFLLSYFALLFLFFSCRGKKRILRIPLLFAMLANFIALGLTYSRNNMLAFSVCFGMLGVLLALKYLPLGKNWQRALAVIILMALLTPAAYKSFGVAMNGIGWLNGRLAPQSQVVEVTEAADKAEDEGNSDSESSYADDRDLLNSIRTLSDRAEIYAVTVPVIKHEPLRLLRGCATKDEMTFANTIMSDPFHTMHNSFLDVLMLSGLPGLMLALAFTVLLVRHMIKLFFSDAPLEVKSLTLLLTAFFMYGMLESFVFVETEIRAQSFFMAAGAVIAWSREICPKAD